MKRLINIALASTVVMLLSTGCGNSNTNSTAKGVDNTANVGTELTLQSHTTSKKLHEAIIKAGKAQGLKMTEFKANAIIAEKVTGENSSSATVTFNKEHVVITKESENFDADGLLAAIEAELKNEATH